MYVGEMVVLINVIFLCSILNLLCRYFLKLIIPVSSRQCIEIDVQIFLKMISFYFCSGKDTDSSAVEEEDEVRALEAKLRCMAQKKKPSQGKEI